MAQGFRVVAHDRRSHGRSDQTWDGNHMDQYADDAPALGAALGIHDHPELETIYQRVHEKLETEPIEDFRIDFEDGYGNRTDEEEDEHAAIVAREIAKGMQEKTLSPFVGIRIKPLNEELRERAIRTLDIVIESDGLVSDHAGLPGFLGLSDTHWA